MEKIKKLNEINFNNKAFQNLEEIIKKFKDKKKFEDNLLSNLMLESCLVNFYIYWLRRFYFFEYKKIDTKKKFLYPKKSIFLDLLIFCKEILLLIKNILIKKKIKNFEVVFVCNYLKNYNNIKGYLKKLKPDEKKKIIIIHKFKIKKKDKIDNLNYFCWNDYRNLQISKKILKCKNNFSFKFLNIINTYFTHLSFVANEYLNNKSLRISKVCLVANDILDKIKPKKIVTLDQSDYESRAFSIFGREKNIKTYCLQSGLLSELSYDWKFVVEDKIGVFDLFQKIELVKLIGKKKSIKVIGSEKFKETKGVRSNKNNILFASTPTYNLKFGMPEGQHDINDQKKIILAFYDLIYKNKELKIYFKPHPEENLNYFNQIKCKKPKNFIITNETINELLEICDIVATTHSTVGLESLYAKKKLVIINFLNHNMPKYYQSYNLCTEVNDIKNFEEYLLQKDNEKAAYQKILDVNPTTRFKQNFDHYLNIFLNS